MSLTDLVSVLLRRWWLVLVVPALVLPLLLVRARTQPFQSSFSAVVLLPGDTELPGSSERPELMVMDDLPVLVRSSIFTDAVASDLQAQEITIEPGEVEGAITASRYSRVLTVTVTRDAAADARAIAAAAAAVLPTQVNATLILDGAAPATVTIIDPPSEPTRARPNQTTVIIAMTALALAVGAGLALVADAESARRSISPTAPPTG